LSEKWEEEFFGKEEKRRKDEDLLKTVEEVFDTFTLQALYKLINKREEGHRRPLRRCRYR